MAEVPVALAEVFAAAPTAEVARVADVDGDGDNDVVVMGSVVGGAMKQLLWFENSDGLGSMVLGRVLGGDEVHDFLLADLDADADVDVVVIHSSIVYWRANDGSGLFGPGKVVANARAGDTFVDFAVGDVTNDGVADIVIAVRNAALGHSLFLCRNNELVLFESPEVISISGEPYSVTIGSVDGDGLDDILLTLDNGAPFVGWLRAELTGFDSFVSVANTALLHYQLEAGDVTGIGRASVVGRAGVVGGALYVCRNVPPLATEATPISIEAAYGHALLDFDGDGDLDVLYAQVAGGQELRVALQNGDGSFAASVTANAQVVRPVALVAADMDGDGTDDLVVLGKGPAPHYILRNAGPSTLVVASTFGDTFSPAGALAAADVDGDGKSDVVVAVHSQLRVYLAPALVDVHWNVTTPHSSFVLAVGDVDGDGASDVVTAPHSAVGDVEVYVGDGTGSFATPLMVSTTGAVVALDVVDMNGDGPAGISFGSVTTLPVRLAGVGDVDADGDLDVFGVVGSDLEWMENLDGATSWAVSATAVPFDSPAIPLAASLADMNGDGVGEFVVLVREDIFVVARDAVGAWTTTQVFDGSTEYTFDAFELSDLNNDGALDMVVVNLATFGMTRDNLVTMVGPPSGSKAVVSVGDIDGDGDGDVLLGSGYHVAWYMNEPTPISSTRFGTAISVTPNAVPHDVRLRHMHKYAAAYGDVDGDGDIDVVTATSTSFVWFANGDGAGEFNSLTTIGGFAENFVSGIQLADMDNDGDLDMVAFTELPGEGYGNGRLAIYLNIDGQGTFELLFRNVADATGFLAVYDVDGDGDTDILVDSAGSQSVTWYENVDGFATPPPSFSFNSGVYSNSAATGDVDGDGIVDAVVKEQSDTVYWLSGAAARMWTPASMTVLDDTVLSAADCYQSCSWLNLGDVDNDGDVDLVIDVQAELQVFLNNGTGAFAPVVALSTLPDTPLSPVLTDVDGDGDVDVLMATWSEGRPVWCSNTARNGTFPTCRLLGSMVGALGVDAIDVEGDGDLDVVYFAGSAALTLGWIPTLRRSAFTSYTPVERVVPTRPLCSGCARTFADVMAVLSTTSRCTRDTVVLPAGRYTCRADSHALLTHSVRFASEGGGRAIFDCSEHGGDTGVLFRVGPLVAAGAELVGDLTLDGVDVVGGRTARGSLHGTPAIRAEGVDARVSLHNVTMRDCASAPRADGAPLLDVGLGGALLASGGAFVEVTHSTVTGSSASDSGGGVYVRGAGTQLRLGAGAQIVGCEAGNTGGGVVAVAGARVEMADGARIASCTAVSGSGGGLRLGTGTAAAIADALIEDNVAGGAGGGALVEDTMLVMNAGTVRRNRASFGGGIAAMAVSRVVAFEQASTSVEVPLVGGGAAVRAGPHAVTGGTQLVDVVMEDNVATTLGGGLAVCDAVVSVSGAASVWSGSTGSDAFVCAAEGFAPSRASAATLPWFRMNASAFAALDSASIVGPLANLEWIAESQAELQSGSVMMGELRGRDWLGQVMFEPRLDVQLTFDGSPDVVLTGQTTSALASVSVPLPQVAATARVGALPPVTVAWQLGVASASASASGLAVTPLTGSVDIVACGVGFGGTERDGTVVCARCADDAVSNEVSFAPCQATPVCPVGTVRVAANGTSLCECAPGFWTAGAAVGEACAPCPRGGVCAGGRAAPVAAPGFFPDDDPGLFVTCPVARACAGSGRCQAGYTSRLCAECADGYYRLGSLCRKCDTGKNIVVVMLLVLGVLFVTGVLLAFNLAASVRYKFAAAMIGLNALQISAMYGKLDLDWGSIARVYFDFASALNLDFSLTSPECAAADGTDVWVMKWVLTLLLPLFAAVAVAVLALAFAVLIKAGVGWVGNKNMGELTSGAGRTWFQLLVVLYLPLAGASFAPFGCRKDESGRWLLDADPSRRCYTSAWWGLAVSAMLAVALYAIGIPGVVVMLLSRRRRSLDPVTFALRFGFLVGRFVDEAWWFEGAIMLRKVGVVMCMTFFTGDDSKASTAAVVLVATLVQLALARPYMSTVHNVVAVVVLAATSMVLYAGTLESFVLRRGGVMLGILGNVLAIVVGNALDVRLLAMSEKAAASQLDPEQQWEAENVAIADSGHMTTEVQLDDFADHSQPVAPSMAGIGMSSLADPGDTLFDDESSRLSSIASNQV
ncbi:uncharacterized protein AMSG_07703 [Thecamonas trahens ATCC 50062]|uniref:DUF7630 domain-containing protein n=1 Tax=Thecamonas trahens ATCC 50062 TaxID=461836 RepID=A0A0L0DHR2_THETB|nr:hypothetical protein AMSG_07703 [Thecamonas trahens ATCC 50062]KNC51641.1 hypothetical protein AMSG_07703 [Thecamonas trahens ATCC 50062]|eukprot:XP_013755781.1 hypothetical protein AMSG_07703 [Thecamonas trahens ATCC 50062]